MLSYWKKLSDNDKSMWGWPSPGDDYIENIPMNLLDKNNNSNFDNFTLVKIDITHVDKLLLNKSYHIRKRWIKKNNWIEERINP